MRPASILDMSSRSSSSVRIIRADEEISSRFDCWAEALRASLASTAPARMALIGVLSSWLTMATKADLASSAASARARASLSAVRARAAARQIMWVKMTMRMAAAAMAPV